MGREGRGRGEEGGRVGNKGGEEISPPKISLWV